MLRGSAALPSGRALLPQRLSAELQWDLVCVPGRITLDCKRFCVFDVFRPVLPACSGGFRGSIGGFAESFREVREWFREVFRRAAEVRECIWNFPERARGFIMETAVGIAEKTTRNERTAGWIVRWPPAAASLEWAAGRMAGVPNLFLSISLVSLGHLNGRIRIHGRQRRARMCPVTPMRREKFIDGSEVCW